jgi:glyceraldehyde-3-phosphate dehydrogenase (NADP+)
VRHFPAYIAGRFRDTTEKRELRAPFDGRPFASVSFGGAADLDEAIAAAHAALPATRALSSYQRATICRQIGAALAARASELVDGMIDESGKPIADAEAEVARAVHGFEVAAAEAERIGGEVIPLDLRPSSAGRFGLTRRFPVGAIAGITPFNFPLNLVVHKLAPAIAAGCPIVLKPAEQTPTSALRLAELVDATAWPKGALSVVPADRAVSSVLATDDRLALLSFTGSDRVGWELKARAGKKRVVLELGGDAFAILDESADLDAALPKLVYGAFSYAGQKCISIQHLLVHDSLWEEFLPRFLDEVKQLRIGDPRDRACLVGPMIDEANARRIESWIAEAVSLGAERLHGGERRGTVVPPTVLAEVPAAAKLASQEAFGPTVNLSRFSRLEDAIARVNASRFGLQAGLFTRDLVSAWRAFEQITVGGLILNDAPSYRIENMPYGGVKDSGFGREGIRASIDEYTEERLLVLALPPERA